MSAKNVTVTVASVVVAQAGFINWIQGTGTTYTVAVNAQTDYITVTDTSSSIPASSVTVDSTTLVGVGTTVQAVFEELDDAIAAATPTYLSSAKWASA
jgi:hypothetical protein